MKTFVYEEKPYDSPYSSALRDEEQRRKHSLEKRKAARNKVLYETGSDKARAKERFGKVEQEEKPVRVNIPEDAEVFHKNYVDYLLKGYANHAKISIDPHIIWYTVLQELAQYILQNPESCRSVFTTSSVKEQVVVYTDDVETLPLETLISKLYGLVPVDTLLFLPEFSTSTQESKLASMASFAEAVTPYYEYFTFLCGYNAIRITGNLEDWNRIKDHALEIARLMPFKASNYLLGVADGVNNILSAVDRGDAEYFQGIITTQPCGSGHQVEVDGWFVQDFLLHKHERPECLNDHIARVPYTNIETGNKYILCYGLFSSFVDEEGFWIPEFSSVINQVVPVPTRTLIPVESVEYDESGRPKNFVPLQTSFEGE